MSPLEASPAPRQRVRSGGRSELVRIRVARACLSLLAEGNAGFGPVDVAARSSVSRATLHRWWPSKTHLLREALRVHTGGLVVPDTGSWADDVRAMAHTCARFYADPVEVSLNAIMASGDHPEFVATVLEHYQPFFAAWRGVVARAVTRGEIRDDTDAGSVLLTLASPFITMPLLFRATTSAAQLDHIVDIVVRGTALPS